MAKRRRKRLADASELYIGPQTKRYRDARKHLRAATEALDDGKCVAATQHLHEVDALIRRPGPDLGTDTRHWFAETKARLKTSCRVNLASRTRQRRRSRR